MGIIKEDSIIAWDLDQIGRLDQYSFIKDVPTHGSSSFSICFWYIAKNIEGIQVLANHFHQSEEATGWEIFIHQGVLVFRAKPEGSPYADIQYQLQDDHCWHHIVAMVDQENSILRAYFDGDKDGWVPGDCRSKINIHRIAPKGQLIIGGFTDPAGGHFDHTFGRNGSGYLDDFRIYERLLSESEVLSFIKPKGDFADIEIASEIEETSQFHIVNFSAKLNAKGSYPIKYYYWNFGDGQTGEGEEVAHEYQYGGEYTITLMIIDEAYSFDEISVRVSIPGPKKPVQFSSVFINGTEGHSCYRIPSIVRASNGDLIAFAEGRYESCSDSTKIIRLVSKRSIDNGQTWEPLQVVSRNIVQGEEFAIQNISPVVDSVYGSGKIVVVYNKVEFNEWEFAKGKGISKCFCISSEDHGQSWQDEKDITLMVNRPYNPDYVDVYPDAAREENKKWDWRHQRPTIGHAIQLTGTKDNPSTKGRLFYSGIIMPGDAGNFNTYNYVFWSDDLGETWEIGGIVDGVRENGESAQGLNEATAVELTNGNVMINSRNYLYSQPVGCRAVTIIKFDQKGVPEFLPTYHDEALVCPAVQASIIRFTRKDQMVFDGKNRILFSNPAHEKSRHNLTIRLSYDEGKTWSVSKVLDPGPSAYSDLVIQENMKIGVLYERGNQGGIYYGCFSLDWLTGGKDTLDFLEG